MDNKATSFNCSLHAIDDEINRLLESWGSSPGLPTCKAGCSNCCRGEIVTSTAEARQLLDSITGKTDDKPEQDIRKTINGAIQHLRKSFHNMTLAELATIGAMQKHVLIGTCPFLEKDICSIYEYRPYVCRAMHSWGNSANCGQGSADTATPLELYQARSHFFSEAMKEEAREGRHPFFGLLSVVLYYLMEYRDAYERGDDFSKFVDPLWKDTNLLCFPYQGLNNSPQDIITNIERQQEKQRKAFNIAKALSQFPD